MPLRVVGAGVGRTGTHSLKLALEQLLGGPCHHMAEILGDPTQVPGWTDAIEGRPVDWSALLAGYRSIVDWPGGAFWRELSTREPRRVGVVVGARSRVLVSQRVEHDLSRVRPHAA
jgi:Sulfotransferase domain